MMKMNVYEISNGIYSAKINLTKGANCISLKNAKYNATILREPDYSKPLDNPYLYGMPILFPVNRISGGRFIFEDREYLFPINEPATGCHLHGMVHEQAFDLVSSGEDYVVCSYQPRSKEQYFGGIHNYEIMIRYQVGEHGLVQKTEVTNLSTENMPVMLGFHTTFALPFMEHQNADDIRVYADITDYIERNMKTYLPTGNVLEQDQITEQLQQGDFWPFSKGISRHYKSGVKGTMCICDTHNQISVCYENSENFGYRLIYNGNADEYICLEPQNCLVNYMNETFDKTYAGFEYLKPGETKSYRSKISILKDE